MKKILHKITLNPITKKEETESLIVKNALKNDGTPSKWLETDKGKIAISTLNKPRKSGEVAIIVGDIDIDRLRVNLNQFAVLWCRERLKNAINQRDKLINQLEGVESVLTQLKNYIENNLIKEQ